MLRDQIVEKICTPCVCERLLIEPELTLEKTITLVRMTETAMNDAKTFMDSGTKSVNAVYKQGNRKQSENSQCYRCGSTNHLANDQLCPAKNARCKKCGKTGHFARVCNSIQ